MIPLHLFRALRAQIPDKDTRLAILRAKSGVSGLFIFKPALGRFEVNSVECMVRMAAWRNKMLYAIRHVDGTFVDDWDDGRLSFSIIQEVSWPIENAERLLSIFRSWGYRNLEIVSV